MSGVLELLVQLSGPGGGPLECGCWCRRHEVVCRIRLECS